MLLRRNELAVLPRARGEARKAERWALWSTEPRRLLGEAQLAGGNRRAAAATFRDALERDPQSHRLWVDLAAATRGREHARAVARARALDPLDPSRS